MTASNGTGRVITASVSSLRRLEFDHVWQITRGGPDIRGAVRVLDFAPSAGLFARYHQKWKDRPVEEWWSAFELQFDRELRSQGPLAVVEALRSLVQSGKRVALVCWCKDGVHCHRSLVGRFLTELGFSVKEDVGEHNESPERERYKQIALF
jgi:uncharacterized protein YeaO (DUF488 family)